jgi:nitrite reductase/ring-hydroxylating ferredoxin subunit
MSRHRIADAEALVEDGDRIIAEVEGQEIGVFRIDGEYFALPNFCPHQAGPLCQGAVTGRMVVGDDGWEWRYEQNGEIVTCPWHGWKFDIKTGENVKDDRYTVPTYDVSIDDGAIYVER